MRIHFLLSKQYIEIAIPLYFQRVIRYHIAAMNSLLFRDLSLFLLQPYGREPIRQFAHLHRVEFKFFINRIYIRADANIVRRSQAPGVDERR